MAQTSKDQNLQQKLKKFLKRRHPDYDFKLSHWQFLLATYEGGRAWFDSNLFKYHKEGEKEFEARLERAYRFNHTREVVDLVDKHLFKQEVARSEDAPGALRSFWKNCTQNNLDIDDFAKRVSTKSSIYGRVWVVVDTNAEEVTSEKEKEDGDAKIYSYIVTPENVLDMSYDEPGELNWILIHEQVRDDVDPIESSGEVRSRYRLWERDQWTLFNVTGSESRPVVTVDGPHPHRCGIVPVIPADCFASDEQYSSPSLIDDVAYLDRASANYLSNLDAIIQDQTFSQLAMPAQAISPGDDAYDKVLEMGTKRIFTYDGEGGTPMYLSPDVKQAALIMQVVSKIISEIYHTVGLAGERTKDDNSQGIDNSSGVAKAYDFERVNSLLSSKADALEQFENNLARVVLAWAGEAAPEIDEELVEYPDDFDVRGLYDEFEIAARLALIEAPDELRREQMKSVVEKMFPMLKEDLKKAILDSIKEWPPKVEIQSFGGKPGQDPQAPKDNKDTQSPGGNDLVKAGKNSLANSLVKRGV